MAAGSTTSSSSPAAPTESSRRRSATTPAVERHRRATTSSTSRPDLRGRRVFQCRRAAGLRSAEAGLKPGLCGELKNRRVVRIVRIAEGPLCGMEDAVRSRTLCRAARELGARNDPRGFTLIELTVVLAVIVTLTLIITPSITNFINDSRVARSRTDTQTVASAVTQFYKDNGFFPQWSAANGGGPGGAANKVDLLVSPGNVPLVASANTWTT